MFFPEQYRIFIKPGVTDMRKSINTLSVVVKNSMQRDLYSSDLFLFCNRRRDIIKVLYWHRTGFSLWQKRLEKNRFPWPKGDASTIELDVNQLELLLKGVDFFAEHRELTFSA